MSVLSTKSTVIPSMVLCDFCGVILWWKPNFKLKVKPEFKKKKLFSNYTIALAEV